MSSTQIGHWRATYTPGRWVVLAGPTSLVVLPPARPQHAALVNALWDDVVGSADISDLAERLVRFRIDQVPHLGVFFFDESGMRSLVRGSVRVVDLRTGDVVADGDGVQTWSEVGLGHLRQVRVDVEPVDQDTVLQLPLVVGAVQASAIVLDATAPVSSSQSFVVGSTAGGARHDVPEPGVTPTSTVFAGSGPAPGIGGVAAVAAPATAAAGAAAEAGVVGPAAASALPHGHETSVSEADVSTAAAVEVQEELDQPLEDPGAPEDRGSGSGEAAGEGERDEAGHGAGGEDAEQGVGGEDDEQGVGGQDAQQGVGGQDREQAEGGPDAGQAGDSPDAGQPGDGRDTGQAGDGQDTGRAGDGQDLGGHEDDQDGDDEPAEPARADRSTDPRPEALSAVEPARRYEPDAQDEPGAEPGAGPDGDARRASDAAATIPAEQGPGDERASGPGEQASDRGGAPEQQPDDATAGGDVPDDADPADPAAADPAAAADADSDGASHGTATAGAVGGDRAPGPWGDRPLGNAPEPAEQVAPLEGISTSGPVSAAPGGVAPGGAAPAVAARAVGDPSDVVGSPEATAQALAADDDEDLLDSHTELMPDAWNNRRAAGNPAAGQGGDPRTAGPQRPSGPPQGPGQPPQWQQQPTGAGPGWGPGAGGGPGAPGGPDRGGPGRPGAEEGQGPGGPQRSGPYGGGPGGPAMAPPGGTGPGFASAPGLPPGTPPPGYGPGPGQPPGPGRPQPGQPYTGQPGPGGPYGPPAGQGPGGWPGPYGGQPGQPGPYGGQPGQPSQPGQPGQPGPYGGQPSQSGPPGGQGGGAVQPGPYGGPGQPGPYGGPGQPGQPGPYGGQPGPYGGPSGQPGPYGPADQPGPYGPADQPGPRGGQPGPYGAQPGQPGPYGPPGGPSQPGGPGEPAAPGQSWAPRTEEDPAAAPARPGAGTAASAPDASDDVEQGAAPSSEAPPEGGLIRGVPGFGDAARPQRSVEPAAPESAADHDGATIFQTGIARRNKPSAQGTTQGEALVLATMCALQHPNPPEAERCRRCGGAVQSQNPRLVPRPVLALLRPSSGPPLEVDRTVLVGRSPAATRVAREHLPRLLTVPSPSHDISRTHVQVTPEGWSLVVTDLHSTNGTTLIRPGEDPERERLTPGEPVTVEPGWVLDLGDGVTIMIERLP